jgi:hypothetical protein
MSESILHPGEGKTSSQMPSSSWPGDGLRLGDLYDATIILAEATNR